MSSCVMSPVNEASRIKNRAKNFESHFGAGCRRGEEGRIGQSRADNFTATTCGAWLRRAGHGKVKA